MSDPEAEPLSYSVSRLADRDIVEVTVLGPLDAGIRKEILVRSADALRYAGYHRLLVDVLEAAFDPDEAMSNALPLVGLLQALEFPPRARIAFLYKEAEEHRKFFEQAAQTGGFNLRYFRDREAAVTWLCAA